ncbi:nicotinate phosphoribosyltransferase, partial [Streptomyces vinaceusdrappus]
ARTPLAAARARPPAARATLPLSATQLSRGGRVSATEYVRGGWGS